MTLICFKYSLNNKMFHKMVNIIKKNLLFIIIQNVTQ